MEKDGSIYRGHIAGLDALRAVGILVVVLRHSFPNDFSRQFFHVLSMGWAFMDSFFVMSGFLITGILLDSRDKPHALRTFFVRRALRILPAYYVVLVVLLAFTYLSHDTMPQWGSPLWFLVYVGNLPTAVTGEWPPALNLSYAPLWSLQVEEQFYLVFPFLVYGLRVERLRFLLLMLVPTSLGLRLFIYLRWPDNELAQYVLLPCHMEGLAIGALIAIRYRSGPWKINHALLTIAAALLALATIAVGREGGWERFGVPIRTLGFLVSSVASAAVVVWLIEFRYSRIVAPLSWRPIQYLGKISYGIYLVHFPVLALIIHFMPDINHGLRGVAFSGTVLATSILIAAISWRFMEEPLLRLKNRVARVA